MVDAIKWLKSHGYQVEKFTNYHYRIEAVLDLYPENHRYHNIADQTRGKFPHQTPKEVAAFVDGQVAVADQILDEYLAEHPGELDDEPEPQQRTRFQMAKPWYTAYPPRKS